MTSLGDFMEKRNEMDAKALRRATRAGRRPAHLVVWIPSRKEWADKASQVAITLKREGAVAYYNAKLGDPAYRAAMPLDDPELDRAVLCHRVMSLAEIAEHCRRIRTGKDYFLERELSDGRLQPNAPRILVSSACACFGISFHPLIAQVSTSCATETPRTARWGFQTIQRWALPISWMRSTWSAIVPVPSGSS